MFEMLSALCVVLGALILLRAGVVRFGWLSGVRSETNRIRVIESRTLGLKQQLHLVEVDGQELLVGATEAGLTRLLRVPQRANNTNTNTNSSSIANPDEIASSAGGELRVAAGPRRLVNVISSAIGLLPIVVAFLSLASAGVAMAQEAIATPGASTISLSIGGATGPDQLSDTLQIVLILTALSVAPSILLMATCFTRILIVLALLRQAIGTATLPPTQVLVGLALMTTVYVMTPVGETVYEEALRPYIDREIGGEEAFAKGIAPVREYLLSHTREDDLLLFIDMKGDRVPETREEVSISVLMPAFMISEIRTAFEIGFMIYLPFLVVDLVIASMLISLGMIMLPPVMIALPFKLMLFVLVDGWNLTLSALVAGLQ